MRERLTLQPGHEVPPAVPADWAGVCVVCDAPLVRADLGGKDGKALCLVDGGVVFPGCLKHFTTDGKTQSPEYPEAVKKLVRAVMANILKTRPPVRP